jgi:predicted small secreted protein
MRRNRLIQIALLAALLLGPLALSACNTVEGAGQDVKKVGDWMERKANQAK